MVLVEFDIHQPLNLKDLENISLLYDNDVAIDFNIFINYLNNEVFYPYINNSKNYLIKNANRLKVRVLFSISYEFLLHY